MGKKSPPDPSFTKRGIHKKPGRARIRVVVLAGVGDWVAAMRNMDAKNRNDLKPSASMQGLCLARKD